MYIGNGGKNCEKMLKPINNSTFPGEPCFYIHLSDGTLSSGINWINPGNVTDVFQVYCDMDDLGDGGNVGSTVIQKQELSTTCHKSFKSLINDESVTEMSLVTSRRCTTWVTDEPIDQHTSWHGVENR